MSDRKADRKGHTADGNGVALSRVVVGSRFPWSEENIEDLVENSWKWLQIDEHSNRLEIFNIRVDWGYGKERLTVTLHNIGSSSTVVSSDRLLWCYLCAAVTLQDWSWERESSVSGAIRQQFSINWWKQAHCKYNIQPCQKCLSTVYATFD